EGLREMIRVLRPGGTLLLVTTRPSVPEAYLRLTWRYRTFDPQWLLHAMGACGLTRPRCFPVGRRRRLARWLSLAYTGRKPSEAGPMPAAPSLPPAVGIGARPGAVDRPGAPAPTLPTSAAQDARDADQPPGWSTARAGFQSPASSRGRSASR